MSFKKSNFPASRIEQMDAELWGMCREGDEWCWRLLVENYQRLICTVPRRAGLSEDSVAEIVQEVFLALLEKLDDIKQPERLRAWLVTTAKFKTWKVLSLEKTPPGSRADIDQADEMIFEIADKSALPDDILIELEEQHLIRTAVNSLDERCRKILTMLYLNEIPASYREVAAEIGVNETSISPLRARCLKKLLKLLVE